MLDIIKCTGTVNTVYASDLWSVVNKPLENMPSKQSPESL